MTRPLNSKFSYEGIWYQTTLIDLSFPDKCVYCGFYDHVSQCCRGVLSVTGDCRTRWRGDKKEVIFAEQ